MSTSFRESLSRLPDQLEQAPLRPGGVLPGSGRLLVGGVGGSAAAGDFLGLLGGPGTARVIRESELPPDVGSGDRLVVMSYSGETRESLVLWRKASRAGLVRGAVASGGALLEAARNEGCPHVVVPPGMAPRLALGHLLRGAADLAGSPPADWSGCAGHLRGIGKAFLDGSPPPPLLSDLERAVPAILSGDPVAHAAARRWSASLAENSKIPSFLWALPEAAHNAIMALSRGAPRRRDLAVIALGQPGDPELRERWDTLLETVREEGIPVHAVDFPHPEPWIRALGLAYYGDWVSFSLAQRLGIDPAPISLLTEVKRRLASGKDNAS